MKFDPSQASEMLGPLLVENALSTVPVFGEDKIDIGSTIEAALKPEVLAGATVRNLEGISALLPKSFDSSNPIAVNLRALRRFVREQLGGSNGTEHAKDLQTKFGDLSILKGETDEIALASNGYGSCREIHEALLGTLVEAQGLPQEAQSIVDHTMVLRAKEKYLFDAATNRTIVADDPWTKFAWDWIAG
jgi:hypothetical protein